MFHYNPSIRENASKTIWLSKTEKKINKTHPKYTKFDKKYIIK